MKDPSTTGNKFIEFPYSLSQIDTDSY